MTHMSDENFAYLQGFVRDRYARSGHPAPVVAALNRHNDRVLQYVEALVEGESLEPRDAQLLKTVAILHDVAKADTPLMLHAEEGAVVTREILHQLGKDDDFVEAVARAVLCHLGPFPFIEEEAEKYAARTGEHLHIPRPDTSLEQLFYDADMLALMDLEGIEKIFVLRSSTAEFLEEDDREARELGGTRRAAAYRSAMQSVYRAADSVFSGTARRIASQLLREAEAYVTRQLEQEKAGAAC
jgi:hypothetical protein